MFHMNLISVVSNNFDALITVVVLIMSIILFIRNTIAPELTGLLCVGIFISTLDGEKSSFYSDSSKGRLGPKR